MCQKKAVGPNHTHPICLRPRSCERSLHRVIQHVHDLCRIDGHVLGWPALTDMIDYTLYCFIHEGINGYA